MLELPEWETEESEDDSNDENERGHHLRRIEIKAYSPREAAGYGRRRPELKIPANSILALYTGR